MIHVLSGFAVIVIVIACGFAVGKSEVLGKGALFNLQMFVYFVATPALLLDKLHSANPLDVVGPQLGVASLSAMSMGLLYFLWAKFTAHRETHEAAIGGLASSYCNASNLGIPIAAHVLGDGTAVVPTLLFQIAFYGPVVLTMLDLVPDPNQSPADKRHRRIRPRTIIVTTLKNPMLIAAVVGLILGIGHAEQGWVLPDFIADPIHLIGQAAVPVALIGFGMSLSNQRVLDPAHSPLVDVGVASVLKVIGHPAAAFIFAYFVFHLHGQALFAACVLGALPTAQNVYTYASRYGRGLVLARDAGVVTTIASFFSVIALSLIFH